MQPDDRDAVEAIVASVTRLVLAVHKGDQLRIVGELALLLTAINAALIERPGDAALVRAVAKLR